MNNWYEESCNFLGLLFTGFICKKCDCPEIDHFIEIKNNKKFVTCPDGYKWEDKLCK